jgi:4-amino-4-deoxy-L-arabinose transferase-like glycosyltransferase
VGELLAASRARSWFWPGVIVLAALALRLGVIAGDSGYRPQNDAFEYDYYARSIAAGHGYPRSGYLLQGGPTAIRGPGYPYFLGAVFALSGDSVAAGRAADALLGALAVALVFLITRRIWGRRAGLVAAAMAAVFPPLVLLSRELWSESLFLVLELAAVLCVLNFRRSGGALRWAAAAGATCGLAALTRNTAVPLLVAITIGVWTVRPWLRARALVAPLIAVASTAIVIAPWTIRNAVDFHRFIPLTTSAGITVSGVYNQTSYRDTKSHGAWRDPQVVPEFTPLFVTPGIDEATVDATLRRKALDFARHHPGYVAETTGWNLIRMFEIAGGSVVGKRGQVVTERGIGSATPASERVGLGIAGLLALGGIAALVRTRPRGPLFLWLIPLLVLVTTAPINGLPRDRLPVDPFLLILAAIGLTWLWSVCSRLRGSAA